ncbi:F-BAR and double SH3 domains protein 2-like [Diadema setosum]|uniref:F-BAR and double SH3 domains protein 2-like n=1 Tax=Diadema setosum TaxID=31175 RepID=UPI003B3A1534
MQPPPRKAKIGQDLKNVQHEQWTKLQSKHQADTDILDDVREFSKQRAAIERIYAQSLTKLASQFLQKRDFPPPSEETEEEQHNRTVWEVWKSLLEETEKNARVRLTAAETIGTQITDSVKLQKNSRANKLKRCGDLASVWHEEVQASVRDLIKARKNYADAEKIAQDARAKAAEAENRLNKGSTKFFQSRSSLEKTTAKLVSRRKTCDRRSAHMRNEYLLCVAAANAHRKRLFETDVPYVMEALDGDFYDRLRNYFRVFSTTEIETSTYVKSRFQKVSDEAEWVTRCYHHQKFLDENAIFTDLIQYVYDPVENDEVASLVMDSTESLYLEREARRWATQVAKESNRIETLARRMDECQPYVNQLRGSDNSSDSGFSQDKDPETKLDTLREERRIAETNKLKAEAKLDVMRNAGIDVEEWLNSAYEAMAKEAEIEAQTQLQQQHNLQHQQHRLEEQQHYESSQNMDDEVVEEQGHAPHVRELHSDSITSFDSVDDFDAAYEDQTSQGSSGQVKCTAIFDYTAQRDDELTIRENDVLELIEESEGDGWVKARNQRGEMGYVPENYIEVEKQRLSFSSSPRGDGSISQQGGVLGHGSSQSSVDYEVQAVMATQGVEEDSGEPGICMVRALYDYTGSCKEELSFEEGTIFKLLRRDENGVDDGFWEGELCGRIGVFPSLLVEELVSDSRQGSSDGESLTLSPDYESPEPSFPPPDFSPPEYSPPPLPITVKQDLVHDPDYEEVDRTRPSSVTELSTPRGEYGYMIPSPSVEMARSVPASPVSSISSTGSFKPARAAPPPPSGKKKSESAKQLEYENTAVSNT